MMKDIPGYDGEYAATNEGNIYSYHRNKYLKPCITKDGYYEVKLSKNGMIKSYRVHRLVLMTFSPIDDYNILQVNHKDENKLNNKLENLEWMTCKDNINYGTGIKRRAEQNKVKVQCVETGQIFDSEKDVQTFLGQKSLSNISNCLSGRQKTCGGFHWVRVIDNAI